jgi:hypothetical protein
MVNRKWGMVPILKKISDMARGGMARGDKNEILCNKAIKD